MKTKVVRIKESDYERMNLMKGYLNFMNFFTKLLDDLEQPKKEIKTKLKSTVHPDFEYCKMIFFDRWKQRNRYEFKSWGPAHAKALNDLIRKIESMSDGDNTVDVFTVLMDKLPAFYQDKYLTAINKNYDSIIAEIKNGGNKGSKLHQDGGIYDHRK